MSRKYKIALSLVSALLGLYYIIFENKAEVGLLLIVLSRFDSLDVYLDDKFKKDVTVIKGSDIKSVFDRNRENR